MKQYKLKKWYPSLAISWRTDDRYEYDADRQVMINISNVKNGLALPKEMIVKKQELHPDFWELIEEEKPLFITEDGAEIFHSKVPLWEVLSDFEKVITTVAGVKVDCKYFFLESNADEYIWKSKPLFSYEDMMKAKHSVLLKSEDIERSAKERSKL